MELAAEVFGHVWVVAVVPTFVGTLGSCIPLFEALAYKDLHTLSLICVSSCMHTPTSCMHTPMHRPTSCMQTFMHTLMHTLIVAERC